MIRSLPIRFQILSRCRNLLPLCKEETWKVNFLFCSSDHLFGAVDGHMLCSQYCFSLRSNVVCAIMNLLTPGCSVSFLFFGFLFKVPKRCTKLHNASQLSNEFFSHPIWLPSTFQFWLSLLGSPSLPKIIATIYIKAFAVRLSRIDEFANTFDRTTNRS